MVTSDYIVAETLNFVRARTVSPGPSEEVLELVFGSDRMPPIVTHVIRVHSGRFALALDRYRTHFDQGLSMTDWTNLVLMEELGIDQLATFDDGFRGLADAVGLEDEHSSR